MEAVNRQAGRQASRACAPESIKHGSTGAGGHLLGWITVSLESQGKTNFSRNCVATGVAVLNQDDPRIRVLTLLAYVSIIC